MNVLHTNTKQEGKVLTGVKHIRIIDNVIIYLDKNYLTIYATKISDNQTNITIL